MLDSFAMLPIELGSILASALDDIQLDQPCSTEQNDPTVELLESSWQATGLSVGNDHTYEGHGHYNDYSYAQFSCTA